MHELETELLVDPFGELTRGAEGWPLLFIYHRDGVRRVPLHPGGSWIIGRDPTCDIQIRDSSLSRQHAHLIAGSTGELSIQDLDSTNGTLINGVRVDRGTLRIGDQVNLGAVTLALQLIGGAGDEPLVLESHDRFLARLAEEVARSRMFRRACALLMISPPRPT